MNMTAESPIYLLGYGVSKFSRIIKVLPTTLDENGFFEGMGYEMGEFSTKTKLIYGRVKHGEKIYLVSIGGEQNFDVHYFTGIYSKHLHEYVCQLRSYAETKSYKLGSYFIAIRKYAKDKGEVDTEKTKKEIQEFKHSMSEEQRQFYERFVQNIQSKS